ncbi:hypothetical protein BH24ACT10_BH24ACT10_12370 [soil metagenome]
MDPLPRPDPHAPRDLDLPVLTHRTADLLRDHVPLILLLDLAEDDGPRSAVRYADEGGEATWLER